jgi:hypothetical protein
MKTMQIVGLAKVEFSQRELSKDVCAHYVKNELQSFWRKLEGYTEW